MTRFNLLALKPLSARASKKLIQRFVERSGAIQDVSIIDVDALESHARRQQERAAEEPKSGYSHGD